jgi:serine/threonine protein kinase
VLHRDLKPGNIMLGPFGETLLVDWGLAKSNG